MRFAHLLKSKVSIDSSWVRNSFLTGCLGVAVGLGMPARANQNDAGPAAAISFDIEAQPLETALDAYGAASGVQVLYQSAMTAGRRSTKVQGLFAPETALRILLSGTGLTVHYTTDDSFTLVPQPAVPPRQATAYVPPDMAQYSQFLGVAQAGVLAALCQSPETRPGTYRATLKFWIDPSGLVSKTALLTSTGDATRDNAILGAVEHARVGDTPPTEMPQPIIMVIEARPPGVTGDCSSAEP